MHVISELSVGGAERIVLQLVEDGVGRGHDVAVASAGGVWASKVAEAGGSHFFVPRHGRAPGTALAAARSLRRAIRAARPELLHAHNIGTTFAASLAKVLALSSAGMVTTVHGLDHGDYPNAVRVLRLCRTEVIGCAPAVTEALRSHGLPGRHLRTITNGAQLEPASADRVEAMRRRLDIVPGAPLVVGIGRIVDQKDWPTFIEAVRLLGGVEAVVAGEGPRRQELAAQAGDAVRFIGPVDDVAALVGAADCIVSTSRWEGLPLTLLEALSIGAPVVATAVDGVVDVVPPGAAVLVPAGSPTATAAAVRELLDQPDRRAALGAAATAASPAWGRQGMLDAYEELYGAVARQRRRSRS